MRNRESFAIGDSVRIKNYNYSVCSNLIPLWEKENNKDGKEICCSNPIFTIVSFGVYETRNPYYGSVLCNNVLLRSAELDVFVASRTEYIEKVS